MDPAPSTKSSSGRLSGEITVDDEFADAPAPMLICEQNKIQTVRGFFPDIVIEQGALLGLTICHQEQKSMVTAVIDQLNKHKC